MKTNRFLFRVGLALLALLALSACLDRITGPSQTTIIDQSQPQPQASPSPGPSTCEAKSIVLGSEGDDFEFPAGVAGVTLVASYFGAQGLELPAVCSQSFAPTYSVTGPCVVSGGGSRPTVTSPTPGACTVRASLGAVASNALGLTVTAAPSLDAGVIER